LKGNGGRVVVVVLTGVVELVVAPSIVDEVLLEVEVVLLVREGDVELVDDVLVVDVLVVVGFAGHASAVGLFTSHCVTSSRISVPPAAPPKATQ
jgi:hypothetical protein